MDPQTEPRDARSLLLREVFTGCYVLTMGEKAPLAQTFQRIQEYYESPSEDFRGRLFSKTQFNSWYEKRFKSSYYEDWSGFNVPDHAFEPFLSGAMSPLDGYEKALIEQVREIPKPFYIIGCLEEDEETLQHEVAHALWYLIPHWHGMAAGIVNSLDLNDLKRHLLEIGYTQGVLADECHAYCLVDKPYLKKHKLWNKNTKIAHKKLKELWQEFHNLVLELP